MEAKEEFLDIFYDNVDRDGADKLLEWLEKSDFFTAPASGRRHSAYKGGLCRHSINVYKRFVKLLEGEYGTEWTKKISPESVAIMGLLHDVCKVDTYVEDVKNVKVPSKIRSVPSKSKKAPHPEYNDKNQSPDFRRRRRAARLREQYP